MAQRLRDLRGLGPRTEELLIGLGIRTPAELADVGPVEAYRLLRDEHGASLNALYALWAALEDVHWRDVPPEVKAQLRAEVADGDRD